MKSLSVQFSRSVVSDSLWPHELQSYVQLFVTQWTVAHQVPLYIEFFRQEYWNGLPFPPPGGLPELRIETASLMSPALADRFFITLFSSVTQSCLTLCNPTNRSMPGLPVHRQLPEFTQTHVHWVGDAIQPSHPVSSPSPPAPNPSQHQSFPMSQLFAWGDQSTGVSEYE